MKICGFQILHHLTAEKPTAVMLLNAAKNQIFQICINYSDFKMESFDLVNEVLHTYMVILTAVVSKLVQYHVFRSRTLIMLLCGYMNTFIVVCCRDRQQPFDGQLIGKPYNQTDAKLFSSFLHCNTVYLFIQHLQINIHVHTYIYVTRSTYENCSKSHIWRVILFITN